ncbi:MAG: ROK family glucokinase [Clostridiales bacterium]|nr:ROK family glucokinase [Clostridiales bacterium]
MREAIRKFIGIDLGGTNIAVGIVDEKGNILHEGSTPTLPGRPFEDIVKDIANCALTTLEQAQIPLSQIESIGVGIPGIADHHTGVILFCTNLGWRNEPFREVFQKYIDKPIFFGNDATVAGFAESIIGVSKDCASSVFLTLGTGVGGGIILNGKPWEGHHGTGSEIGHVTLVAGGEPCTCGKRGCLERYCSATALIRMGNEGIMMKPNTVLNEMRNGDPALLTGKMVIDAAKEGDAVAVEVFSQYITYLTTAINTIITFLDPEMIVLGGGVSKAGDFLLEAIKAELPKYLLYEGVPYAEIKIAQLGGTAGIVGAAMLGYAFTK